MKHLLILLGITIGFLSPLTAHAERNVPGADPAIPQAKAKEKTRKGRRVVVAAPAPAARNKPAPQKVRYEITKITVAGSHLPVVLYHDKGEAFAGGNRFAPRKAYRREGGGLDTTGSASIGGELTSLDPSFH